MKKLTSLLTLTLTTFLFACSDSSDTEPNLTEIGNWSIQEIDQTRDHTRPNGSNLITNFVFSTNGSVLKTGEISLNEDLTGMINFDCVCFDPDQIRFEFDWIKEVGNGIRMTSIDQTHEISWSIIDLTRMELRVLWTETIEYTTPSGNGSIINRNILSFLRVD